MLVSTLALPTTIVQLITVIYNTADTYYVSALGKSATASIGVVFSIMSIVQACGFSIGIGASTITSQKLGEKDNDTANLFASSAICFAIIAGFVLMLIGLLLSEKIVYALGATETMISYSMAYAKYIFISAPVMCAAFVLNLLLRSEGDAYLAMIGLCTGGILNVVLDPIFIFRFQMGVAGAAVATAISQCVSFIILFIIFLKGKSILKLKISYRSKNIKDYILILSTGLPTLCRQGLASIASALINLQASIYGDAAIAAITIANKVYIFVRQIVLGIGQGFQPVAGYNYGAKKYDRVLSAFRYALIIGTSVCVVASLLMVFRPDTLIGWFIKDSSVIELGALSLEYGCFVMPFMAYSTYVNQLYQSLGLKKQATFLAMCRQGIMFFPLAFILPFFFGLKGIQATQPAADFLTFLVSIPFQIKFVEMIDRKK